MPGAGALWGHKEGNCWSPRGDHREETAHAARQGCVLLSQHHQETFLGQEPSTLHCPRQHRRYT